MAGAPPEDSQHRGYQDQSDDRSQEKATATHARRADWLLACGGRCLTAVMPTTSNIQFQDHCLAPAALRAEAKVTMKVHQCTLGYAACDRICVTVRLGMRRMGDYSPALNRHDTAQRADLGVYRA